MIDPASNIFFRKNHSVDPNHADSENLQTCFAMYYKNRLLRTEVNTKKGERTRQQAAEMKEMQKFLLIKVSLS